MRIILGFLIVIFCGEVWASCPATPNSQHIVVTIEGLAGRFFGSRARQLARKVNSSGYDIADFSHNDSPATIAKCIMKWKQQFGSSSKISILGHSMGGPTADRVARELSKYNTQVDAMLLFDPRHASDQFTCKGGEPAQFPKPPGVRRLVNFHQCGTLAGRTYTGSGVENIELNSVAHIDLPQSIMARDKASAILNGLSGEQGIDAPTLAAHRPSRLPSASSTHSGYQSPFLFRGRYPGASADLPDHSKGAQPAICFNQGAQYECTYQEATRQNRDISI